MLSRCGGGLSLTTKSMTVFSFVFFCLFYFTNFTANFPLFCFKIIKIITNDIVFTFKHILCIISQMSNRSIVISKWILPSSGLRFFFTSSLVFSAYSANSPSPFSGLFTVSVGTEENEIFIYYYFVGYIFNENISRFTDSYCIAFSKLSKLK